MNFTCTGMDGRGWIRCAANADSVMTMTPPVDTEYPAVICPACRRPVGELVPVGHELWLKVAGVILHHGHGRCQWCGAKFHFVSGRVITGILVEDDVESG